MNGPLKMYRTKQVISHDFKVALPDCMYTLKNIHAPRNGVVEQRRPDNVAPPVKKVDIFDQVKQFLKSNQDIPEMAELELRQEQILQQLAELKKQMDSIRSTLSETASKPTPAKDVTTRFPDLPEIIIYASPTHPPYSLALIQKLWKNYIFLSVKSYVHSSTSLDDGDSTQLTNELENFIPESELPQVSVRLIWKDVGANPQMILFQKPISGEVNILRYLSRVSFPVLNYETYLNKNEIDSLLDVCHCIIKSKTKTERASLLQVLNKSLGKDNWLGGRNVVSIADLAAYSAVKQVTSPNEINVNLGKWLQRCVAC